MRYSIVLPVSLVLGAACVASASLSAVTAYRAAPSFPCAECAVEESAATLIRRVPTDKVIVVEGHRDASEASVSTKAMHYLPFEVPEGVTRIAIHKDLEPGPGAPERNTVDMGLFDPRGYGEGAPGFRGWQGGAPGDLIVTGDAHTASPHAMPGPIPAGRWYIAQYFLKGVPAGLDYKYTITLSFDGPMPPKNAPVPPRYEPGTLKNVAGWYAGNLHSHTVHSDGGRTLEDLMAYNKAAGFDFLAVTDHNSPATHFRFAEAAKAQPGLLLLYGEEFTSPSGHANILGQKPGHFFDFRMDAGDGKLPGVINAAHQQKALFVVNHPFAFCTSCTWKYPEPEWKNADAIEVWNGKWTPEDRTAVDLWDRMLKQGRSINAFGGTDYHRGTDALTPAAYVHAEKLATPNILDGLRHGHVTLTESPDGPRLYLSTPNAPQVLPGDTLPVGANEEIPIAIQVTGGRGMRLRLIGLDSEMILPIDAENKTVRHLVRLPLGKTRSYIRAELLRGTEDPATAPLAALTNPIYLLRK